MAETETDSTQLDLLYPFYLDTNMSMAFSAALTGGVALEEEHIDRDDQTSQAIRNLRGNLRLWRAGGIDAGRESRETSGGASESKLIRRHTMASIFIDLYDELRRTGRLVENPDLADLQVGSIVSIQIGPAVAPLRRVVDQVIRLLDVMQPVLDGATQGAGSTSPPVSRQDRRERERQAAKAPAQPEVDGDLEGMRRLFIALRDDLERSGMIDIVVSREDAPSVVLTLDKQFVTDTTLELLHTSGSTVVGKVTQIWPTEDDVVLLYRRSVLSLVPSLSQAVAWGVFAMLATLARSIGVGDLEQMAREAVGGAALDEELDESLSESDDDDNHANDDGGSEGPDDELAVPNEEESDPDEPDQEEVRLGDDIAALNPALLGPAVQILPLAICA